MTRDFFTSIPIRVIVTPRPDVPFPALRWGVIVGEIVHNLASALDNLVSELVEVNPSPPPPPPGANRKERSRFKKIRDWQKFPICATRPEWGAALDRDIMYVDPISQATLEEAQPFYGWENFGVIPKSHPLFILHKLWNRDKHSTVNLAGAGLGFHFPNLELPGLFPGHGYLSSETIKSLPSRPIVGDTEVAIIRVLFPHPIEFRSNIEVSVKPNMSLTILFGEGAPGEGENVFDVPGRARDTIVNLLNRFA